MLFEKFRRKKKERKEAIVEKDEIKADEMMTEASNSNENDFEVDVQEIGNEELKNKRLVEITDKIFLFTSIILFRLYLKLPTQQ